MSVLPTSKAEVGAHADNAARVRKAVRWSISGTTQDPPAVAAFTALLQVVGDYDAFASDLDVVDFDDVAPLGSGFALAWVELDAAAVAATGSFESTLFLTEDPLLQIGGESSLVPVDALEIVDPDILPLVNGDALNGITFEACP